MTGTKKVIGASAVVLVVGGLFYLMAAQTYTSSKMADKRAANVDPAFTNAINSFGLQLHATLRQQGGENVFISPISIATALSMTYEGTGGQTRSEIAGMLGYRNRSFTPSEEYSDLLAGLDGVDADIDLAMANSVWFDGSIASEVRDAYRSQLKEDYRGQLFTPDSLQGAVDEMNAWVEEETDGRITNMISELPGQTAVMLLNAIHFKGGWTHKFDEEDTNESTFYTPNGTTKVDMMYQEGDFGYHEENGTKAIRLPYGREQIAMYVFVPGSDIGTETLSENPSAIKDELDVFVQELDPEMIDQYISNMQNTTTVEVFLPRFGMEYGTKSLVNALQALGVEQAFDPSAANLSRMVEGDRLWIADVLHKATIEVDETGTEASAATGAVGQSGATLGSPEIRVDRPYLFFIRDDRTGAILFMGSVYNPE